MKIGQKIRNLRKKHDLTIDELARAFAEKYGTGTLKSTISLWENEKQTLSIQSLEMYADYFNVSLDYLKGTENKNNIIDISELSSEQQQELNEFITFNKGMFMAKGKKLSEHDEEKLKETLIQIFLETENK